MDIEIIRRLVKARRYQVKLHAVQHALQEGFDEAGMVAAILSGRIIEVYPERRRVLVCGKAVVESGVSMYLHVVCEQNYADQIEFVTAYIPGTKEWGTPPVKRRR